jgi:hypothetical protein
MVTPIYHERQRGGYCRLHALNNLIGEQVCDSAQFDKYCDEYDSINKFSKGTSKQQFFYNNGDNNNIFGYVLEKMGYSYTMHHYDFYRNKTINVCENTIGYILYSKGHAFCIRKHDDKFYLIDSMKPKPVIVNPAEFCNKKILGVIHLS